MNILGIETSCDETSVAVVKDGELLSHCTASQSIHRKFGGVIPELASRAHIAELPLQFQYALDKAGITLNQIDAIASVYGPGLVGSILAGLSFAKGLSAAKNIPFIGINHMVGHIYSNFVNGVNPVFPFLNLTVSGGHTQLVIVRGHGDFRVVGETLDDAAGEAFDKVAKMLGLPYPGGPNLDRLAAEGDPFTVRFPRSMLDRDDLQFSFSGIKTSVFYYLKENGFRPKPIAALNDVELKFVRDVCAGFQCAVIEILMGKSRQALRQYGLETLAIAGGVAANSTLRKEIETLRSEGYSVFVPAMEFCTDNAAMIAMAGYHMACRGELSNLSLAVEPYLQIGGKNHERCES